MRTYFRFLLADGVVARDPSERLETPKRWRTLPEVLTVDEVERLIAAPTLDDPLVFRDRAMLELAYGAGLARLGVDHARRARRPDRGQARARLRQGEQGATRPDRTLGDRRRGDLRPRAAAAAGEGGGEGHPLPQCARRAADAHGRLEDPAAVRRAGGDREARLPAHACATPSRRTCSRAAPTSAPCRRCSATPTSRRRRSTRTSTGSTCGRSTSSYHPTGLNRPLTSLIRAPVARRA